MLINFILKSIALETGNDKINDTVSNGSEIARFLADHHHQVWSFGKIISLTDFQLLSFKRSTDSYKFLNLPLAILLSPPTFIMVIHQ